MTIDNNIQNAKKLCELKQYEAALKMALTLYDNEIDAKEALLVAIESILGLMDTPTNDNNNSILLNTISKACENATTVEEVLAFEARVLTEFDSWHIETIKKWLRSIENSLSEKYIDIYLTLSAEFASLRVQIIILIERCALIVSYCEDNNITREEFSVRFNLKELLPKGVSLEEEQALQYDTAVNIFEKTKAYVEENAHCNINFAKQLMDEVLPAITTARVLLEGTLPKDGFGSELRCERLRMKARILNFMCLAEIYPNGQQMYLWHNELRAKYVKEVEKIILEIKDYESSKHNNEDTLEMLIEKIKEHANCTVNIDEEQRLWENSFASTSLEYEEKIEQENLNHEKICKQIETEIIEKANQKAENNKLKLKEIEDTRAKLQQERSKLGLFNLSAKKEIDAELTRLENNYKNLQKENIPSQDELKAEIQIALKNQKEKHQQNIELIKTKYNIPMSPKEKEKIKEKFKNGTKVEKERYHILLIMECAETLTAKKIATLLEKCFEIYRAEVMITAHCRALIAEGLINKINGVFEVEYSLKK